MAKKAATKQVEKKEKTTHKSIYINLNIFNRRKKDQGKERQERTKESHLCLLLLSKRKKRDIEEGTTIFG